VELQIVELTYCYDGSMSTSATPPRARGEIETLPSGSLRVRVYDGVDPLSKKRRYLTATVPAGPQAAQEAERLRDRLLEEARERRRARTDVNARPVVEGQAPGVDVAAALSRETVRGGSERRTGGTLTLAAIAKLAGVSPPTVSKVLNGRAGVAAETRRRVEELLREQGYRRPEKVARAALVEVVFYGLQSQLAVRIMRGVKEAVVEHGLAVGFTDVQREAATGRDWAQDLLARRPTGVIIVHMGVTPEQHAILNASGIPMVVVDPPTETRQRVLSVSAANRLGAIEAAQHLLDLGHRRIAVITGPLERLCARARLEGTRMAMEGAGVPLDERLVRAAEWFAFEGGLDHARDLLRLAEPPTAVLCGNDLQAFGVYEAARQAGVRIPDQLSVVGFDDISYAHWCAPPMTSVRQPFVGMGTTAARLLLAMAAGDEITHTHIELATTLVIRDSTAPPRNG
jgi:LacI family transcriptional regulator, xylobiose transport system transcriptional regulator